MKIRNSLGATLAAFLALLLGVGCTSPEARIRDNAELFAGLGPEDQQLIREGKIAIGFTPEMVHLAVGEPDRIWKRTDENGISEVWTYTAYETPAGAPLYRGWYHHHYHRYDPLYPYYLGERRRVAREIFRVTFREGVVAEVELDTTR